MDKTEKFWNNVARKPPEKPRGTTLKIVRLIQQYLKPEYELLDIGCGNGSITIELAKSLKRVDAIDISSRSIELARQASSRQAVKNIAFRQSSIDEISSESKKYCIITTFNVLQYVENCEGFVKQVHKLLSTGGFFISSTPCLGHGKSLLKGILKILSRARIIPPARFYSGSELEDIFKNAGFEVVNSINIPERKEVFLVVKK